MEFREVVARRRMVRAYRREPVDSETLQRVLDRARRGPSAGFSQGQHFVVVTEAETRRRIAELCREPKYVTKGRPAWLSTAPVHVIPCVREQDYHDRYAEEDKSASDRPSQWQVPYWWVDGGAALMLLLLAAVDEGLGAGFLDVADHHGLRALLGIPEDLSPLGLVTIGHPLPSSETQVGSARRGRRHVNDTVHFHRP